MTLTTALLRMLGPAMAMAATLALACTPRAPEIDDQTVEVGCGMCRFHQPAQGGCYWAARFGDRVVPVRGDVLPADHENHAPDGMCNVTREAVVSGTLYDTYFAATKFELKPVAPAASPEFGPDDAH